MVRQAIIESPEKRVSLSLVHKLIEEKWRGGRHLSAHDRVSYSYHSLHTQCELQDVSHATFFLVPLQDALFPIIF